MNRFPAFFALICLWLTGFPVLAAEITSGPQVEMKGAAAVVRWSTDVSCGTVLKFGVNPNNLNHRVEGDLGTVHEVRLEGLTRGETYYYQAGTAKKGLKTGQFTAGEEGRMVPAAAALEKPKPVREAALPPVAGKAPPAKVTWGDLSSLEDHYLRHGRDFGSTSPAHYAQQAWEFYQRAIDEGLPAKMDGNGVIRIYEARTKSFAAYNRDGTAKTYFKPQRPDYFHDQPGKPVRLNRPAPAVR